LYQHDTPNTPLRPLVSFFCAIHPSSIHNHSFPHADTLSPVYGETFTFKVPDDVGLHNVVLNVKIMDYDPLVDDQMGSTIIKLEPLGLSETPSLVTAVVDKKSSRKADGKIFLALSYKRETVRTHNL
jgi:hypothetical protein